MAKPFKRQFSHTETWQKLKVIKGMKVLIESALLLYCLMLDADIPKWVKVTCITALCYLVLPTDTIPDVIPVLGYTDDLLCLSAAIAAVSAHVKPHHKEHVNDLFNQL
jgi:uncharacterized membrane protein YkvA (DUF1232 family)